MKFSIILDKEDYLTYHLYQASSSPNLRKRRFVHWGGVPLVYFITGYILRYLKGPEFVQAIFLATGIIWFFAYPFYSKWAIRRFLTRQISEKYAGLEGKEGILDLSKDNISVKNEQNAMTVAYKDVKGIAELQNHFLVELEKGYSLILPKSQFSEKDLSKAVNLIAAKSGKNITDRTTWKWK